ncbi:HlyD family type I secretion periplasmic adaptor subunit [Maritimibacter sp. DP1N21-5]|uniref:HlyD family type I secretion periplasmic adaptor subunit n=1 Tax=Maritimibacter sp. DP1N21-5 TaxID=2836867 RepID=UPI001C448FA0|nr:HlyD family type I secretion periplasmic adaptor subunit [Maritimibacter sp. DP1N21-5]MBV7410808.1 HlyD family type I secretion periplasmic adaptor subunit [Maritimibacter sp. DP1N21-5]
MTRDVTRPKPLELTNPILPTAPEADVARAWSARSHVIAGFAGLVLLVGGFGTWSITTDIAGAIVAPGAVEAEQNRQVVQHPDGGVIDTIEVREGDRVEPGDVLIRLDPEQLQSELTIVQNQLFELVARRGRLEAERDGSVAVTFDPMLSEALATAPETAALMDGQVRLFTQRRENLAAERSQLEKRVEQIADQNHGIDAQQTALSRQLSLIEEELANKRSLLDRSLVQSSVVLALERDQAAIMGQQGELTSLHAQNEGRITEIEIEILKLDQTRREEAITMLRDLGYQELELAERRRALKSQLGRLDIRAPLSGVVHAMQVFAEREVIGPAQPLLYIVPQDNRLVIAAQVDPIHIDEIHVGQEVSLRLASLDSRQTPVLEGRVLTISADALIEEATGRSYYRARIELSPEELARLPEGTVLIPGMPVESYLRTADRTPLAYLVKPLADYFNRAFRES